MSFGFEKRCLLINQWIRINFQNRPHSEEFIVLKLLLWDNITVSAKVVFERLQPADNQDFYVRALMHPTSLADTAFITEGDLIRPLHRE